MKHDITPSTEVNDILTTCYDRITSILAEKFIGIYLYGSLAIGDFDADSSDIDLLVVTTEEIRGDLFARLQQMHRDIAQLDTKWGIEIEASYLPKDALWKYDINNRNHPHIDRGSDQLTIEQYEMDWIVQRYSLREHGIVIDGPPIQELIAPISLAELLQALWDLMDFWWIPMITNPVSLQDTAYRTYAILTMCRILYTTQHGQIISKNNAAHWAKDALDSHWQPLINRAFTFRNGTALNTIADVQGFIAYTAKMLKNQM